MTLRMTRVRRLDPWSAAKVAGAFGALAGLITGLLVLAALVPWSGLFAATFPQSDLAGQAGTGAVVAGALLLVLAPLAGAVIGFVVGGIAAFLANLALGFSSSNSRSSEEWRAGEILFSPIAVCVQGVSRCSSS